jgi:hypothetical protein
METSSHQNNIKGLPTKKAPDWVLTPEEKKVMDKIVNGMVDSLNKSIQESKKKSS